MQLALGILVLGSALIAPQDFQAQPAWFVGRFLLAWSVQALAAALSATALTVMYYRLREVKESIGVEDMVSVFD